MLNVKFTTAIIERSIFPLQTIGLALQKKKKKIIENLLSNNIKKNHTNKNKNKTKQNKKTKNTKKKNPSQQCRLWFLFSYLKAQLSVSLYLLERWIHTSRQVDKSLWDSRLTCYCSFQIQLITRETRFLSFARDCSPNKLCNERKFIITYNKVKSRRVWSPTSTRSDLTISPMRILGEERETVPFLIIMS